LHIAYCTWQVLAMPVNGLTTSNHTKSSTPSCSPLGFGIYLHVGMSNGPSSSSAVGPANKNRPPPPRAFAKPKTHPPTPLPTFFLGFFLVRFLAFIGRGNRIYTDHLT
jgi:hypothetical protein